MIRSSIAALLLLAMTTSASSPHTYVDPSCAYIYALPQHMHPGVPQPAAAEKCRQDCAQPGYNCQIVANNYPSICACGHEPHHHTPAPTPKPTARPTPSGDKCNNPAYHQCGGNDGYHGETCCPYYQGQQQFCHRESDQYWQCCPPGLAGCGGEFWTPYKNSNAQQPAPSLTLGEELVRMFLPNAVPSGTYVGQAKKMGETVKATVTVTDTAHFDVDVQASGLLPVSVKCSNEVYSLNSDGTVNLPNMGTQGDCLHDQLDSAGAAVNKVTYDSKKNTITLDVQDVLKFTVVLKHQKDEQQRLRGAMAAAGAATTATATASPIMPSRYGLTLSWTQQLANGDTETYNHKRWYDIKGQRYRDDTFRAGELVDQVIQLPQTQKKRFDVTPGGSCAEQADVSRIDGFVQVYDKPTDTVEPDMVDGVRAKKYTRKLTGYTVAVWFADGDTKVADGTPLQTYNSYNEEQKVQVGGITKISHFVTDFDAETTFALPDSCKHPATPAPTPTPPTPSEKKHWIRNWQSSDCSCIQVSYIGTYTTESECEATECKKPAVSLA